MLNNLPKLRWACRRGMLELDLILEHFLTTKYQDLSDENKVRFINLLEQADPDLFAWLMGKQVPEDEDIKLIVDKIRGRVIAS